MEGSEENRKARPKMSERCEAGKTHRQISQPFQFTLLSKNSY